MMTTAEISGDSGTAVPAPDVSTRPTPVASAKIRHEWFQNDDTVTISIYAKQIPASDVTVQFQPRALCVTVRLSCGSDYVLDLEPLFMPVETASCSYSVLRSQIEVKLRKATVGLRWQELESSEEAVAPASMNSNSNMAPSTYPSSSKKQHNWDAIANSMDKDKAEGEQALGELFQQIYRNANDDVRKAMMKSYTESNGTCLSTNWAEVGKGKVETTPPDGMIAKKYET